MKICLFISSLPDTQSRTPTHADSEMKMFSVLVIAVLAVISSHPQCTSAAAVNYPSEYEVEEPQLRERRSPQWNLSGGGSGRAGTVRLDGNKQVYNNGRTSVDANGFGQRSWQKGTPSQNNFGAGGQVTRNVYKGKNGAVDVYGGYQRQWNTPDKHNAKAGVIYRW